MKTKPFLPLMTAVSTALILILAGCTHRPLDHSMGGWGHMMGYGGYGGMFIWFILIVIGGIILYFILSRTRTNADSIDPLRESPMDILKKRYARGEISKEEFERMKKEIKD